MTKSNTFDWLCVQIPLFSEGFRLPFLMVLREVAPDVSHHLQDFTAPVAIIRFSSI